MMLRIVIAMVGLVFFTGVALASPPSAIKAVYDAKRGELDVAVQHEVTNLSMHYIKEVIVTKNGQEVGKLDFDSQSSHREQTMSPFKLTAQPGDVVKVKATCNIEGSKEVTVDVSPTTEPQRAHPKS